MKVNKLIIALCTVAVVWLLSGIFVKDSMDIYSELVKPSFSPPGIVFAIVWPILYLLMGISFYFIIKEDNKEAISIFLIQLLVNFFWPILFFVLEFYLFSAVWILILIVLICITIYKFYKINKLSAILLIPYILWCIFALYLNFNIYLLN